MVGERPKREVSEGSNVCVGVEKGFWGYCQQGFPGGREFDLDTSGSSSRKEVYCGGPKG